ncbi:Plug domain-containing protein [Mongoliibacter sp.]|uniref:Plug domain-containing protein n=1 Tax=Mongoliibacter sp. TaxID=2022438 RepID=UPI0025D57EB1|nr:Plug domain-containing protein [Mongoliibacter sp.]
MIRSLFLMTFLLASLSLVAQDFSKELQDKIAGYVQSNPYEKVYLHTDKSHYFSNDTIWVKAYGLVENGAELPQATPTVPLYVNLYSNLTREPVEQMIIRLDEGMGFGDMVLPRDINPGNYSLIAYSKRSEEMGEHYLFAKDIWIGDIKDAFIPRTELEGTLNVSFFPEGGDLVEGLESKVGFKATGDKGLGEEFYGFLIQNQKDTLLRFESNQMGMGSFAFIPEKGSQYIAYVKSLNSKWKTASLPKAKSKGSILRVDVLSDEDLGFIEIESNDSMNQEMLLVALSAGKSIWRENVTLENGSAKVTFEKDDFPPGITQITMMEAGSFPIAERLVYMHPYAQAQTEFSLDKASYKPKEWVEMDILVMDEFGAPLAGNFSIAVTDAGQVVSEPHAANILSHYRLSAELKGLVENPYYYFDLENAEAEKHLDELLLTQGWRRFSWEKLADKNSKTFDFEKGLKISGQVKQLGGNPIKEPHQVTLMVNSYYDLPQVLEGETDEEGRFLFSDLDFTDSVSVFTQAYLQKEGKANAPKKNNDMQLDYLDVKLRPDKLITGIPVGQIEDLDFEYVVKVGEARNMMEEFILGQEVLLQEITVEASNLSKPNDYRTLLYGDRPDASLPVKREDFVYANAIQFLRGRVPGVQVIGDVFDFQNPPRVIIRGGMITGNASGRPQNAGNPILIDGQPSDVLMAMSLNMIDIERVDVIKSQGKAALMSGVPYINILTKTGNPPSELEDDPRLGQGNDLLFTKGYVAKREFYVPSGQAEEGSPFALDFRSTLYWNPSLSANEDGRIRISFPLNEGNSSFDVSFEGLSDANEPVYGNFSFSEESRR